MRTIKVCPGIGDNIWLFQKLSNLNERFHFQMSDKQPQRGKQIFDLVPSIAASCSYVPNIPYKKIKTFAKRGPWHKIKETEFFLEANTHLENGNRIESFLPDLSTRYTIDYATTKDDFQKAKEITYTKDGSRLIGIYGSSYSTARAWGFWNETGWYELISYLHQTDNYTFVIIGASFDEDLSNKLIALLDKEKIKYINTVGQPLSTVIEILKRLKYFFGFPSGLSILNETLGKDGLMFYPPHLKKMIGTWCSPLRYGNGFKECLFCSPEKTFTWWIENYYPGIS